MIRSETGLYHALSEALKVATEPLTAPDLYKLSAVRKYAVSSNRVSDYLGNMWRDGVLKREPAPRTEYSSARWAYTWKGRKKSKQIPSPQLQIFKVPGYTITVSITPDLK